MADQMKPTPRSTILGLFSDVVNLPLEYMSSPERTQQMQGAAQFLYGTGIPKTLERMSYGDSLFTGSGMTLRPREETINAAMNVAPFAPVAGRVAGRMIKATEGLPVGMSIKDVGKEFPTSITNSNEVKNVAENFANQFRQMGFDVTLDHSGSKAGASSYLMVSDPQTGRFLSKPIRISDHSKGARELDANINVLNPQEDFAKIISALNDMRAKSDTLVFKRDRYAQELIASGVKPKTAYQRARTEISENQQSPYPQQAALTVKPPTDDVYEVMDATFNYGKLGGNKTIPIDQLTGGVRMSDPTEARRVKELADKISSPEGYISRIIVDDSGNVLEGQHRLEALRLLGEKNVPVAVIEDLSNKYNISAMENAIQGKFRSDQSNQLIRQAIDTLEEAGSVEKALSDYSMPAIFQQPFQDAIRASQKVTPTPIESPAYTDPFGNTIGSSIR